MTSHLPGSQGSLCDYLRQFLKGPQAAATHQILEAQASELMNAHLIGQHRINAPLDQLYGGEHSILDGKSCKVASPKKGVLNATVGRIKPI